MEEDPYNRIIGGEAAHRGMLGLNFKGNKLRWIGLGIVGVATLVFTPALQAKALITGAVLMGIIFLVTVQTERGSVFSRAVRKHRMRERQKDGSDRFVPYTEARWEAATAALESARGRKARAAARRELRAIRPNPDGADMLGWLQYGVGQPGIAWQAPGGEEDRLTVAFELPGQLKGLATAKTVGENAAAFGRFVAARVPGLATQVQIVTRVLPTDAATYEHWIANAIDPDSPEQLQQSYAEAVELSSRGTTQRHFLTVTWPLDTGFVSTAERYGEEEDGWRALMQTEIADIEAELRGAGYQGAKALSARELAAVMKHMQNPSRPLDLVGDISPGSFGEPSHDEFSTHVVSSSNPFTGEAVEWWHRTARITPKDMNASWRTPLWHIPLFVSPRLNCIRTVSWHIEPVPADIARSRTRQDLVSDEAERIAARKKGHMDDGEITSRSGAQQRAADLRAGSGHHGAYWLGYVTVTARTRDGLAQACRDLETVCRTDLDIERVEWLDSYQSSASGTTWPIGRGLKPLGRSGSERLTSALSGRADKEALT